MRRPFPLAGTIVNLMLLTLLVLTHVYGQYDALSLSALSILVGANLSFYVMELMEYFIHRKDKTSLDERIRKYLDR